MIKKVISTIVLLIGISLLVIFSYSQITESKRHAEEIKIQKISIRNVITTESDIANAFLKYAGENKGSSYILAAEAVKIDNDKCINQLNGTIEFLDSLAYTESQNLNFCLFIYFLITASAVIAFLLNISFTSIRKTNKIKRKRTAKKS